MEHFYVTSLPSASAKPPDTKLQPFICEEFLSKAASYKATIVHLNHSLASFFDD